MPAAADSNIFTLDSDFKNFTNMELATFSFSNKEKNVKSWRELVREVTNNLYEIDEYTFMQAAEDFISGSSEGFRDPMKICGKFYIESKLDTKTLMGRLKKIVEKFDSLSGANFKDEIWFTLKN